MDTKSGIYSFQLDNLWFTLDVDLLHSALGITPKDFTHPFVAPPVGDLVIDFMNNLGYPGELYFVSKMYVNRELDEVFRMHIPKDLISDAIRNSEYYHNYLEMAYRKLCQATIVTDEEGGKKKKTPPAEKTSKPSPSKKIHKGKVMKVCKGKRSDHLVDEEDEEDKPASEPQVEDDEYNLHKGIIQKLSDVEGKGKGIANDEQAAQSLLNLQQQGRKDDTSANMVHDTPSSVDAETGVDTEKSNNEVDTEILNVGKERSEDVSNTVALEERTVELDEGQARSNPVYPQVHKSLKLTTKEHVHIEKPPSSSGTLSSMKNLDDAFSFGDQFLNDKPTEEEPDKANVETKVESMVTFPIHQASHPEHTTLYDALELSMDHENREKFKEATAKSRKRRYDDQDPPPPPPKDSDQSKKKRHDSNVLASKQPSVRKSSAWKTPDTKEAPSSLSKQYHASPPSVK
uniref:Histone deacetylase 14 n=1 Tax=Tanacetum cinerariifolium TaxID=118510 RepID=A0A6L2P6R6_TANCI|nr:hypothetical protein [Tanacetum cinerariifolium]